MKRTATIVRRNGERGQVLILALVALILVVIAALLLFDVHTVIRGKVKAQNGVDAAALTAAEWQKHSLNVIGELNMYRATGVLLSEPYFGKAVLANPNTNDGELYSGVNGIPNVKMKEFTKLENPGQYFDEDDEFIWEKYEQFIEEIIRIEKERRYLMAINELISQMQTRLAFVGPLIAFGAAQQAARNNGLTYNRDASRTFDIYRSVVAGDNALGEILLQHRERFVYGYGWRAPYLSMLDQAIGFEYSPNRDRGTGEEEENRSNVCVGTNFTFAGMPELVSDSSGVLTSYLGRSETYMAILHRDWINLGELLDYDFPENWWNTLQRDVRDDFTYQSEILPLHIAFDEFNRTPYDDAEGIGAFTKYDRWKRGLIGDDFNDMDPVPYQADVEVTETETPDGGFHKSTKITVGAPFGGFHYNKDDKDLRYNILPQFSWAIFDPEWQSYGDDKKNTWEGDMLRSRFKEGMDYQAGARAYFNAEQKTATITGSMGRPKRNRNEQNVGDVFVPMAHYDAQQVSAELKRLENAGFLPKIQTDALAKPTGVIKLRDGTRLRPFEAGRMILPVFEDTALIPVSLEPVAAASDRGSLNSSWLYYLLDFVPELGSSFTITDAFLRAVEKHPERRGYYMPYYLALLILNDPQFRQEGREWMEEWKKKDSGGGGGGGSSSSGSHVSEPGNEFRLH